MKRGKAGGGGKEKKQGKRERLKENSWQRMSTF